MIFDYIKHFIKTSWKYDHIFSEISKTITYSKNELEEYQNELLSQTIQIAYDHVPFYRKCFHDLHLKPKDIQQTDDLQKLPIIDKNTVLKNFHAFKNRTFRPWEYIEIQTSGTTGTPGKFLRDIYSIQAECAFLKRYYQWTGKPDRTKRVVIRGDKIFPIEKKKPPFWIHKSITRELIMSAYHLNDETFDDFLEEIYFYDPYDLYAYPSNAFKLAKLCENRNKHLNFRSVYTSSEMLFPFQKETIEKVFNSKIYDWYGSAERVAAIAHCPYQNYHEVSDYSVCEYQETEKGNYEIIGTTLYNHVMPLIRYKTGDIITFFKTACHCNSHFRRIKTIFGRNNDNIILKNGKTIRIHGMIFKNLNFIKEIQIIQKYIGELDIHIIATGTDFNSYRQILSKKFLDFFGKDKIRINIQFVSEIYRTPQNKFKLVINLLERNHS